MLGQRKYVTANIQKAPNLGVYNCKSAQLAKSHQVVHPGVMAAVTLRDMAKQILMNVSVDSGQRPELLCNETQVHILIDPVCQLFLPCLSPDTTLTPINKELGRSS